MDVRSWDFSKTWMYFQATTAGGVTEKFAEYAASLPKCKVFDFRGKAFDKGLLDKAVEENRFIVVDGTSLALMSIALNGLKNSCVYHLQKTRS